MNIILGNADLQTISERYTVLPLDQIKLKHMDDAVQSYCLVENLPISDMFNLQSWIDLHNNLMVNYARRNWLYCLQAIEHLRGKWNGELDSFYAHLESRIKELEKQDLPDDWSPVIHA